MKQKKYSESKLKILQSKIAGLESRKKVLNMDQIMIMQEINKIEKEIQRANENIERLIEKDIIVSEHCLLRYFERVLNYNLEDIKKDILTEKIKEQYRELGAGTFPNEKGNFKIIIKNNVVITLENERKKNG